MTPGEVVKVKPEWDLNPDFCNIGTVLFELCYYILSSRLKFKRWKLDLIFTVLNATLLEQLRERPEQDLNPVTSCILHVFFTDFKVMHSIIMSHSKYSVCLLQSFGQC